MAAVPHYPEFDCESTAKAARWTKYVKRLKNYFVAHNIEDDKRQKAILLTFVGEATNDIINEIPQERVTPEKNETHFDKFVSAVHNHFNPENDTEYNRFVFRKIKQNSQGIEDFYRKLKEAAAMCRFSDMDSEVISQLITGCLSEKVRQKGLMNSDISLHDLINYARTTETIASHLQTMRLEDNIATATTAPINKVADEQRQPSNYPRQYQCRNCNGKYPHERGPTSCPAFHTQCTYCGRWGHFTSVCFRRLNDGNRQWETNRPPRTQTNRRSVNRIENDQRNPHSSGSDTEYVFHKAGARNLSPPIEMDTPANRSSSLFLGLPNQIKG
ncbi:unnamed protein product [Acanthosepion pharaonis]|uniref:CCHC-type domain-containing protein n=1 Tax=Acanthosepion pharaonis TaxID=158019 RepID=A0A812CMB3_ACAPH|nr:unnamed protein product [Sepia pharaonis]